MARNLRFDIECAPTVPRGAVEALASLAAGVDSAHEPDAVFRLDRSHARDGRLWVITLGREVRWRRPALSEALDGLMHDLTQRVIDRDVDVLALHAAAVASDGTALVLPGRSGAGKSTLCARLLQAGFTYMSDESVGLGDAAVLHGYPKPIGFKWGSVQAFADLDLDGLDLDPGAQSVWHVPPARFGAQVARSAEAAVLAFPQFEAGSGLRFDAIPPAKAAFLVLSNVQNLDVVGTRRAVELASELAARCACHSAVYGDAEAAARELHVLVANHVPADPRPWRLVDAIEPVSRSGPSAARGVVAACFADGALLVHEATGRMLVTGGIGSLVWPRLDGEKSLTEIASALVQSSFAGVPAGRVARELDDWVVKLADLGFVHR